MKRQSKIENKCSRAVTTRENAAAAATATTATRPKCRAAQQKHARSDDDVICALPPVGE